MADVTLPAGVLCAVRMPALCARTGRPTGSTAVLHIPRTPGLPFAAAATAAVLPAAVPALLPGFVSGAGQEVVVRVPVLPAYAAGRPVGIVGTAVTGPLAFVAALLAALYPGFATVALALGSAAAFALYVRFWRGGVRGRWVDATTVRLTGLHPVFAAALTRAAGEPAAPLT